MDFRFNALMIVPDVTVTISAAIGQVAHNT